MILNNANYIERTPVYGLFEEEVLPDFHVNVESRPLSPTRSKEWIDQYFKTVDKEAATFLNKNITHIPFPQFQNNLLQAASQIAHIIPHSVFLIEPEKSQLWVARIVTSSLRISPYAYLRMGGDSANLLEYALHSLPEEFNLETLKNIVIIDDGAFSGNQMSHNISQAAIQLKKFGIESPTFHIVIPYITNIALERLSVLKSKGINLHQCHIETMPTVIEIIRGDRKGAQLEKRILEILWKENDEITRQRQAANVTMTYFDHNVPNSMSFPRYLVDIGVVPEIIPIYKTPSNSTSNSTRSTPLSGFAKSDSTTSLNRFTPTEGLSSNGSDPSLLSLSQTKGHREFPDDLSRSNPTLELRKESGLKGRAATLSSTDFNIGSSSSKKKGLKSKSHDSFSRSGL